MLMIKNDFKTIQFVCYNSAIDTKETRVYRYLLSKLLVSHTNKYLTKLDISVHLEALYGALLSARTELNGNINTLGISLTIADPKIVADSELLDQAKQFFHDIIFDHDSFNADIFEDEKRILIEMWQSIKDNKSSYANYQFSKLFRLPDLTGYPISGPLSLIRKATPEGLYRYYKDVFLKEDMHIIINGNIENNDGIILKGYTHKDIPFNMSFRKMRPFKEETETTDMNQAIIKYGYMFPIYRFDQNYPAALIANLILGGYPESRLFKDIREKQALCYDVSSNYDVYKGTLVISSGVAIDTLDNAKTSITKLVDDMIENGITDHELKTAKGYVIHQLKAALDHQSYFTKKAYYTYLTGKDEPIDARILGILDVTVNDVNKVLKELHLDTIYVLKGEKS